jgi:hypothetical protein
VNDFISWGSLTTTGIIKGGGTINTDACGIWRVEVTVPVDCLAGESSRGGVGDVIIDNFCSGVNLVTDSTPNLDGDWRVEGDLGSAVGLIGGAKAPINPPDTEVTWGCTLKVSCCVGASD